MSRKSRRACEVPRPPQGASHTMRPVLSMYITLATSLEIFAYNTSDGRCEQNVTRVCDESGQSGNQCIGRSIIESVDSISRDDVCNTIQKA